MYVMTVALGLASGVMIVRGVCLLCAAHQERLAINRRLDRYVRDPL